MKKRVNISIEEDVLASMDKICEMWGFNRSEFLIFLFFLFTNTTEEMHKTWELWEQDTKSMLMKANINGYTEGLKDSSKPETVTEFADRCRECGAEYGKLLKPKTEYFGYWLNKEILKEEYILKGTCSKCGKVRVLDEFCSNCGARMKSEVSNEDSN